VLVWFVEKCAVSRSARVSPPCVSRGRDPRVTFRFLNCHPRGNGDPGCLDLPKIHGFRRGGLDSQPSGNDKDYFLKVTGVCPRT
jgi:hypothetical protein